MNKVIEYMNKLVTLYSFVFLPPYVFDSVTKAVLGKSEVRT